MISYTIQTSLLSNGLLLKELKKISITSQNRYLAEQHKNIIIILLNLYHSFFY